jgi:nucleotide-binding universal stress UspA family protein
MRSTVHLVRYLKYHNVVAEIIAISKKDNDLPETILQIAEKMDAGMIVMGAILIRFRESILGGVTSYMLQYANRPIFMAH